MTDAFPFCTDIMDVFCKFLITMTARQPDIVQVHYTNAQAHMMQYVRPCAFTVVNFSNLMLARFSHKDTTLGY